MEKEATERQLKSKRQLESKKSNSVGVLYNVHVDEVHVHVVACINLYMYSVGANQF